MRHLTALLLTPFLLLGAAIVAGLIVREPAVAALVATLGSLALYAARERRVSAVTEPPVRLAAEPEEDRHGDAGGAPSLPRAAEWLRPWLPSLPEAAALPTILGTVAGRPTWLDLAKAPHLLIGGSTGSGKSTFLHGLIASTTALQGPERLRVALIDPKRVELSRYRSLPHLAAYASESTDARRILAAIEADMDRRYRGMEHHRVRDISETCEPRVLVVIDEYADLILTTRRTENEVEPLLARLLALGRAAGVHVVLATQRPDRSVVTGLIKANAPTRIAFRTANSTESRIVLDAKGAEALPGMGAGLIMCSQVPNAEKPGTPVPFQGLHLPDVTLDAHVRALARR